jgi:glycosidase
MKHGVDSAYADWFIIDHFPIESDPPSYQTCGGAHYLPKLNTENPDVQDYLLGVTRHWLEQGTDGWRLDVPWKASFDFWRKFRSTVTATNADAYIVGEMWRGTQPWLQGDTLHGVMNYRLRSHILDFCAFDAMDAEDFDYELRELRAEQGETVRYHLTLLGSHDTPRILTLCRENVRRAMLCAVFQMTYIGVPMIYYGDEVGMVGENDPFCRGGMQWDETLQNRDLFEFYRKLICFRRQNQVLVDGDFETLRVFNGVYAYRRYTGETSVIVVLNPRDQQQDFTVPLFGGKTHGQRWQDALTLSVYETVDERLVIDKLPPESAMILTPAVVNPQIG